MDYLGIQSLCIWNLSLAISFLTWASMNLVLIYFAVYQEKRRSEVGRISKSPSTSKFNNSNVSYESGFVLSSSAQQREIVSVTSDDPMLQQIQIITGYIAQARSQNR